MTATLDRPIVSKDGKLKFRPPDKTHFVWQTWDEMSPLYRDFVRQHYPAFVPEGDGGQGAEMGRYADLIAYYQNRVEECRRVVREGRDGVERGQAQAYAVQYQQAIENLREAELLPEEMDCWFAVIPGELKVRIAPVLPYDHPDANPEWTIKTHNHVVRLSDPIYVAWMRRLMRQNTDPNRYIEERTDAPGRQYYPRIHEDSGKLLGYSDYEEYLENVAAGAARG